MPKKLTELDQIIPAPETLEAYAQNFKTPKKRSTISETALRRSKVREFMKMGYGADQISIVLSRGITVKNGTIVKVSASENIIGKDISYIRQEIAAEDVDFREKRADIIEKLGFLYNQSIREYLEAKGAVRNSFLNTALTVLGKIVDIEGLKSPEGLNVNLGVESRISKFATEIYKLNKDDKSTILTAIRKVREQRKLEGIGNTGVPGQPSRIPAPTSNNKGVSRKS